MSLTELFETHRAELLGLIRARLSKLVAARIDAEDVLSNTFLKAHHRWSRTGASQPPRFEWLRRLAYDCVVEAYREQTAQRRDVRRQQRFPSGSGEQFALGAVSPETGPGTEAERLDCNRALLRDAIRLLPENGAEVLRLMCVERLTVEEIAARLSMTAVTVRKQFSRALSRLRERMCPDEAASASP